MCREKVERNSFDEHPWIFGFPQELGIWIPLIFGPTNIIRTRGLLVYLYMQSKATRLFRLVCTCINLNNLFLLIKITMN